MIREITGDLLTAEADIICHQANYYGVMGGGMALSIWNKILPAQSKRQYQALCRSEGRTLLGKVQYIEAVRQNDGTAMTVANLFCQDEKTQQDGGLTRYDCMLDCLQDVEGFARAHGMSRIALPGYMGCGIAGGDWQRVYSVIRAVFDSSPVDLTIVYWGRDGRGSHPAR